ncbi:hypothetical protein ACWY2R_07645 [Enterococcus avium]
MAYKDRKNYLFYTSTAFLMGAVIYGVLFFLVVSSFNDLSMLAKIFYLIGGSLAGGYLVCSILSGILLFKSFISKQSKKVKFFSIIFFLITIQIVIILGFFTTLPYFVHNVIQVRNRRYIVKR